MAFRLRKSPSLGSKQEAYPYQLDAVMAVKDLCYAAIFHEQGLGKTKIAIDLVLYWLTNDLVDTAFIVTKKSWSRTGVRNRLPLSYNPKCSFKQPAHKQYGLQCSGTGLRDELRSCFKQPRPHCTLFAYLQSRRRP